MTMSGIRGYPIKEWLTSYYVDSSKRWVVGQLILTEKGLVFMKSAESKPKIKNLTLMRLDFDKMGEIKKKSSSLVFGAVVIIMIDGACHWFSSLKDRKSVFNTLLHFWKYRLVTAGADYHRNKTLSQDQTNLGKAILKVAYDSESTLEKAATSLHHQGEQLDGAIGNMCDIHNDLDVTDHMLSGLEQWLGRWCMPNERPHAVPVFVSDKDRPDVQVYDVIYTKVFAKDPGRESPGSLMITSEGLTIHGANQDIVQYYKWKDISRVKVLSPWEFIVSKFLIGQPDLSYSVTATKMVEILSRLEKRSRKIEYDSPPSSHLLPPGEASKGNKHRACCMSSYSFMVA